MRRVRVLLCKRCGFVVREMESGEPKLRPTHCLLQLRDTAVCVCVCVRVQECSLGLLPACVLDKRLLSCLLSPPLTSDLWRGGPEGLLLCSGVVSRSCSVEEN